MTVEFTYDAASNQAKSSDANIFVERLTVSREQIYAFCLNWHTRRIVFNATITLSGSPSSRHHNWTIIGVGKIHLYVPTYHFKSKPEFNAATRLALDAMKVMPLTRLASGSPRK